MERIHVGGAGSDHVSLTVYHDFADKQEQRWGLDGAIADTMQLRDRAGTQEPFYHAALAILRERRRTITAHGLIHDDLEF